MAASRPPEPSDVLWENLGVDDAECMLRQVCGTILVFLISMFGVLLISLSSYLTPELLDDASGLLGQGGTTIVGTLVILVGYLSVFLTVPPIEDALLRHKSFVSKEISIVLKLILFQVLATIGTANVFVFNTGGKLNRDWYMLGGAIVTQGMFVDLLLITCLIQGWGLKTQVMRRLVAPNALTQSDMNEAYAVEADIYVVDRLQLVTKFVVMCLTYSSALPMLYGIVFVVMVVSEFIDRRNLLRMLVPPPQSGPGVAKAVIGIVFPIAILLRVLMTYITFTQLDVGQYHPSGVQLEDLLIAAHLLPADNLPPGHLDQILEMQHDGFVSDTYHAVIDVFAFATNLTKVKRGSEEEAAEWAALASVIVHTSFVVIFLIKTWGPPVPRSLAELSTPFLSLLEWGRQMRSKLTATVTAEFTIVNDVDTAVEEAGNAPPSTHEHKLAEYKGGRVNNAKIYAAPPTYALIQEVTQMGAPVALPPPPPGR